MKTLNRIRADAIFLDKDGRPVMLIEAKGRPEENVYDRPQLVSDLQETDVRFPYALLVTLKDTRIFKWDGATLSEVLHLPTADILSPYDPEFPHKRVSGDHLTVLIEGWLRDVSFRWQFEAPPFLEALDRLGLAERLAGGMTENTRYSEEYDPLR